MPQGPNAPYTNLDQNQILQRVFKESDDRLLVDAQVTATIGTVECVIDAASGDSIKISDGTDTVVVNTDGSINTIIKDSAGNDFSYNNPLQSIDYINGTGINVLKTVTTTPVLLNVSGTNLSGRKLLVFQPQGSGYSYGYSISSQPFSVTSGSLVSLPIGPNISVWIVKNTGTNTVAVAEFS